MFLSISSNFPPTFCAILPLLFLLLTAFISQTASMLSDAGDPEGKSIASSSSAMHQQPFQTAPKIAESIAEGSGSANPDDEDGDVGEGSGDGMEGSGAPPSTEDEQEGGGRSREEGGRQQQEDIRQRAGLPSEERGAGINFGAGTSPATLAPAPVPPPFPSSSSSTTTTTARPTTAATTTRPKLYPQPAVTTTRQPGTTTTATMRPKRPPPPYMADDDVPIGPLDQLKPGIFALMVGGAVVALLLVILLVTYVLYRIRKKDEGSYTCEEPVQPHHYSYAYQKASIKEFYA